MALTAVYLFHVTGTAGHYRRYGSDSGVFVSCDRDCRTIDNEEWERQISEISDSIIFIDEGNRFLTSKKFAELVQRSDNYFVIATREKLPMLPYSVNEIYGFRKSGKFHEARQTYNEIYHLYGEISEQSVVCPQYVLTEDSNSGYEFFLSLSKESNISCTAANGKSNIISGLQKIDQKEGIGLVIVDGAAFGSEMRDVSEYLKEVGGIVLYAPESFEWLLLSVFRVASAFYRSDPGDQGIADTGASGRLYRQQGVCKLGKIFHRTAGEPDTG